MLFFFTEMRAQVCNGALGDPVVNIDFGRGPSVIGPALSTANTNYPYFAGTPNDGQYTIAKNTFGMHNESIGWFQFENHTPNDPNGYMMVVNADNSLGIFYQTTVNGLCPGTTYEFAAWILNMLNYSGLKPNVTFTIETSNGTILKSYNTADILETNIPTWKKYTTVFTTTTEASVVLKITNNGPKGNGNDLALDDITFRPCGPEIKPIINNQPVSVANICEGTAATINLSANISQSYAAPAYQWQVQQAGTWNDLAGQNLDHTTISFPSNKAVGTYRYRLLVAEQQNINAATCRVSSTDYLIHVVANPAPVAAYTGVACVGKELNLSVNGNIGDTFVWTGPNGFSSTAQNPVLSNLNTNHTGNYQVTVTNSSLCSTTSAALPITVLPAIAAKAVQAEVEICAAGSAQLGVSAATGASYTYSWLPVEGLSDPTIANPMAAPLSNTTYTVTVSNGNCAESVSIQVRVLQQVVANAGAAQKIMAGQTAQLNGQVHGDGAITYLWSPATYLDDPTKLAPIAMPPTDITYTLTATTACNTSTSTVFIKVYPKIDIPNTFSPNGDGLNDTWDIAAASAFTDPRLKIFSRNGQLVYESKGAFKAWDGKHNGNDLPVAAYYYTLYLNEDFKPFTGWIMLIR